MPDEPTKTTAYAHQARGRAISSPRRRYGKLLIFGFLMTLLAVVAGVIIGRTGAQRSSAIGVLDTSDFHALAFSPTDPNTVFFGHHNGIMRSTDGGRTWSPLVDRPNFDAMGLAINGAAPQQMYLAGHDIFQMSMDAGASWQPVATNLPGTDMHGFAISPDNPRHLFAMVVGAGVMQSADGGTTWQPLVSQLPSDVMTLTVSGGPRATIYAAGMRAGMFRSVDDGQTWTHLQGVDAGGIYTLAVGSGKEKAVYAAGEAGLFKSLDAGTTWNKLPFPRDTIVALATSPSQANLLLALSLDGSRGLVYRSDDGGQTWLRPQ